MHAIREHVCVAVSVICVQYQTKGQATCRLDGLHNHNHHLNLTASSRYYY